MSLRLNLGAGVAALAIAGAGLGVPADGESQTAGVPLSKEEYQQQAFHFDSEVGKANRIYYDLAVESLPRAKCGAGARRYHRKLAAILAEASPILPPPEIADVHGRLMAGARHIVRGVARIAKRAQSGRVICGYDIEHPGANEIGVKVEHAYSRSGFEAPLDKLYELDYILGGE
jgi:hypothetical protein